MSIFNRNKCSSNNNSKQTYTYFIPSPPERSTPYQEKAFDQVTQYLNKHRIEFNITNTAVNDKGVWVFIELFGEESKLTKVISEMQASISSNVNTSSEHDLELYYEDHEEFHKDDNFKA